MVSAIRQIEMLTERLERTRKLVEAGVVHPVLNMADHYAVESSTSGSFWLVNGECGCPDAVERTEIHKGFCKHKLAVELFKEQTVKNDVKPTKRKTKAEQVDSEREALYRPESEAA